MAFLYSRHHVPRRERWLQRSLEMLPGTLSWTVLLGMPVLSWRQPLVAAALIIAFYLYWLFRVFYLTLFLVVSYLRLAVEQRTNWMECIAQLERARGGAAVPLPSPASTEFRDWLAAWLRRRELTAVQRFAAPPPPCSAIHHVIIFSIAKEGREIYEPGVASLTRQEFPARQLLVVLAVETRAAEAIRAQARAVAAQYRDQFLELLLVEHPDGVPGEARVKGANVTCAAKAAADELGRRGISLDDTIVSCFDADTVVGPTYLSCLTYHFLLCPQRTRASFQPIPVYHNNIWQVPSFARVQDVGASFFQLIEATNPEKLVTFSSHSMSFRALHDVGYWPVDMISEDSGIFWKALIHFGGDYRVVPIYVTVSMDVAAGQTWWQAARNVYRQKRRWAWGVENFPLVVRGFLQARGMRWWDKLRHAFKMLEGHVTWATAPFLLTIIGWLPGIIAAQEFATSVMYYTAPRIAQTVFRLAALALVVVIGMSLLVLPRPPARHPFLYRLRHIGEWLLIPIVGIALSALPALDAQTRLLLGRSMEFWVTEKHRLQ